LPLFYADHAHLLKSSPGKPNCRRWGRLVVAIHVAVFPLLKAFPRWTFGAARIHRKRPAEKNVLHLAPDVISRLNETACMGGVGVEDMLNAALWYFGRLNPTIRDLLTNKCLAGVNA
jgi:hypothetical protein